MFCVVCLVCSALCWWDACWWKLAFLFIQILAFVPQIALALQVLTSSIGVSVYRFFGFVLGGRSGRVP